MKIQIRILFCCLILLGAFPVFSQDAGDNAAGGDNGLALFVNGGFGIAYNVYLEDAQNELVDDWEILPGLPEVKDKSEGAWGYTSIGVEPRYFSGNIVYGIPLAYYNVSNSKRVVSNGITTYESTFVLDMWSVSCTAYYKINRPDSNYLLLGGGLGLYFGTIEWNLAGSVDSDTKWTIGWQTGIEYHWVWGNVDIYLGATSRFAEIITFRVHDAEENNMIAGLTGLNFSIGAGYRF